MQKIIKKIKKTIKNNQTNALIIIISLIAFIIGGIATNFLISLLIVGVIDSLLFLPNLRGLNKKEKTKGKKKRKTKKNKILKIIQL